MRPPRRHAHAWARCCSILAILVATGASSRASANFEKSVLQPVRVLNWLGYTLDLTNGRIHVSKAKIAELLALLDDTDATVGSFRVQRIEISADIVVWSVL